MRTSTNSYEVLGGSLGVSPATQKVRPVVVGRFIGLVSVLVLPAAAALGIAWAHRGSFTTDFKTGIVIASLAQLLAVTLSLIVNHLGLARPSRIYAQLFLTMVEFVFLELVRFDGVEILPAVLMVFVSLMQVIYQETGNWSFDKLSHRDAPNFWARHEHSKSPLYLLDLVSQQRSFPLVARQHILWRVVFGCDRNESAAIYSRRFAILLLRPRAARA